MNKTYSIYSITNKANGRVYIGCSSRVEIRLKQHFIDLRGGYHHNEELHKDFLEFGEENFETKIITTCCYGLKALLEGHYIAEMGSESLKGGYNLDEVDLETLRIVKHKSTTDKVRKFQKKEWDSNREKMVYQQVVSQPTSKPILFINLEDSTTRLYQSVLQCVRGENVSNETIVKLASNFPKVTKHNGRVYSAVFLKDFEGEYNSDLKEVLEKLEGVIPKPKQKIKVERNRKIHQYDLNMQFIRTFENMREVTETLGIGKGNVHQVAAYIRNQTGGFKFRYADKEKDERYRNKNLPNRKVMGEAARKKVINPETGEVWGSIQDAAAFNGMGYSALKAQLTGQNKNSCGLRYLDDYNNGDKDGNQTK